MDLDQADQLARSCELFRGLTAMEVMELIGELQPLSHSAGDVLFTRGSAGNALFIVLDGLVDLVAPVGAVLESTPTGPSTDVVVATTGPGGFFGEIACLEPDGRRTAGAVARTDCRLIPVPRDRFLSFLRSHPNAALAVIRFLGGRVRQHTDIYAGIRNTNEVLNSQRLKRTLWERFSDYVAEWSARWSFTAANLALWAGWLGTVAILHFGARRSETAAFGVYALTLWVSLQTIIMTTFILVSQRRAQEISRLQEDQHYLAAITTRETTHLLLERLERLERRLEGHGYAYGSSGSGPHERRLAGLSAESVPRIASDSERIGPVGCG
jgi:CRP-like cAMP-binding protein